MDYTQARQNFGMRIRWLRQQKKLTQEQFAEQIGKSVEHVSFLERGERSPSFELILDIASALGVSIAFLMDVDQATIPTDLAPALASSSTSSKESTVDDRTVTTKVERASDQARFQTALEGIRKMQELATEYGISDILQDNGGKVLQVLILLGLRISPGREGNDALDADGNEYELKTINRSLNKNAGVTTHHHLNKAILDKYRSVKAWFVAIYEGIELVEIYRVEPQLLEPLFAKWERRIENEGPLNNPKIPVNNYIKKGKRVYPIPAS